MNGNVKAKIYASCLLFLYFAGGIFLVCLPIFSARVEGVISVVAGLLISWLVIPFFHEIGHIAFAFSVKMRTIFCKIFCFKIQYNGGRYEFSLVNPFLPDQTQVVPMYGENMEKRVKIYALGGFFVEGGCIVVILVGAILSSVFRAANGVLWGMIPYALYHFLLNVAPFAYPDGKTDSLIYLGIKNGAQEERLLLKIMELQGRLYAGERYSKIEETAFEFPVVAEDNPLFMAGLELKYRRALSVNDYEEAVALLQRIVALEDYMTEDVWQKQAGELVYLHTLSGDRAQASECAKLCEEYLKSDSASAKRILATVAYCDGNFDGSKTLIESARRLLEKEKIVGEKLLEEELLARLRFE